MGVGLITQDQDNPGHLTLDKGYNDMSKFLNRILGMQVNLQNQLFKYFTDTLNKIIDNVSVFFIYPYNNFFFKSMNIVLCLRSENLESNSWGPQFFLKTNEKNILSFWKNWGHHNLLLRLSDLYTECMGEWNGYL